MLCIYLKIPLTQLLVMFNDILIVRGCVCGTSQRAEYTQTGLFD